MARDLPNNRRDPTDPAKYAELLTEYRQLAADCAAIDYSDKRSVRANNRAVKRMYELIRGAAPAGDSFIAELAQLLDDPVCSSWMAHQLLECCEVSAEIERRCLRVIERLAEQSMGERLWLKRYHKTRNPP